MTALAKLRDQFNGARHTKDFCVDANLMAAAFGEIDAALTPAANTPCEGFQPEQDQIMRALLGARFTIDHDGFVGTVIGYYRRDDGKRGVVLQQDGTKVVHVYGEKWLKAEKIDGRVHL